MLYTANRNNRAVGDGALLIGAGRFHSLSIEAGRFRSSQVMVHEYGGAHLVGCADFTEE